MIATDKRFDESSASEELIFRQSDIPESETTRINMFKEIVAVNCSSRSFRIVISIPTHGRGLLTGVMRGKSFPHCLGLLPFRCAKPLVFG